MTERRVVVVTGASAGVGRATSLEFAGTGAAVGLLARDEARLREAAQELESRGAEVLPVVCDVSDAGAVERAATDTERELGPIDVWVNNAMASVFAPFLEIEPGEFERATDVTYMGIVNGTRAALRRMVPRDRGVIVQVGSALAYRAIPLQSAYCAAKHAVKGFTESVRCELLHEGSRVHVTMVQLPALNTPQFDWVLSRLPRRPQPVPPIYQPEVAARAIEWASRQRRREVWVGGTTTATLLAQKIVPGLLDRYLGRTGYDSQQTEEPADPEAPSNLWEPVPGSFAAHGRFNRHSHGRSLQWWLTARRRWLLPLAAAGAATMTVLDRRGRAGG
jgi:NAD(P)-dependent dehydrogenase (short-subunit alcohol dehydrogenase family)